MRIAARRLVQPQRSSKVKQGVVEGCDGKCRALGGGLCAVFAQGCIATPVIAVSFVKEPIEENANVLFVTNATRNIQKPRRDQEVVF